MSTRYHASTFTSAAPALNTPFFELRVPAGGRRAYVEEIGVFLGAATATNVALVRTNAQGAGGANSMVGLPEEPANAVTTTSVQSNAFTTAPTFTATNAGRRAHLPAAIGAGLIWTWPQSDRLVVVAGGSLVLFTPTIAGAATISTYCVWTE